MRELIIQLQQSGVLKTARIIRAFLAIDRKNFVPREQEDVAYADEPLPIGWGQTISQPTTVAFMLELLQPEYGDKVLDIGSGSGWVTALLAHIVSTPQGSPKKGEKGSVYALERICELVEVAHKNLSAYNFIERGIVDMRCTNAQDGLPKYAPFRRIHCAASLQDVPKAWKEQLSKGGRLVAPIGRSLVSIIREDTDTYQQEEYPGFVFVPFIADDM